MNLMTLLLLAGLFAVGCRRILAETEPWLPTRPSEVRRLEVLSLFCVAIPVLWLLLFEYRAPNYSPQLLIYDQAIAGRNVLSFGAVLILSVLATGIFCAWKFDTGRSALLMGLGIAIAATVIDRQLHQTNRASKNNNGVVSKERRPAPGTPIRFETYGNLPNAELTINNVSFGKLPIETTVEEVFTRIPAWQSSPPTEERDRHTEWVYGIDGHIGRGSKRIHPVRLYMPHEELKQLPAETFYCRVTNGEQAAVWQNSSVTPGPDGRLRALLHVRFLYEEQQAETLLDIARLNNYRVSDGWLEAFQSFKNVGHDRLFAAVAYEPEVQQIVDALGDHTYGLNQIRSPKDAWQTLQAIAEKAADDQRYSTNSVDGHAVARLITLIDHAQLVAEAKRIITQEQFPLPVGHGWEMDRGEFTRTNTLAIVNSPQHSSTGIRNAVIAHAVWLLDRSLDEADDQSDNIVETELVPAILNYRFSDHPQATALDYAEALGGAIIGEFLRRQYVKSKSEDTYRTPIGSSRNTVNRWFARLMQLDSQDGRNFRATHRNTIIEIARNAFTEDSSLSGFPQKLNYLFLADSSPSLAAKLWPDLKSASAAPIDEDYHSVFAIRWHYLTKLWPESTPEMFVDICMDHPLSERFYFSGMPTVSAEDQFTIFSAIRMALENRQADFRKPRYAGSDPHSLASRQIEEVNQQLQNLRCPQGADEFVANIQNNISGSQLKLLHKKMSHDAIRDDHVIALSRHDNQNVRIAAILAVLNHPTETRLKVLEQLQQDGSSSVKSKADEAFAKLQKMRHQKLPSRHQIPPVAGAN